MRCALAASWGELWGQFSGAKRSDSKATDTDPWTLPRSEYEEMWLHSGQVVKTSLPKSSASASGAAGSGTASEELGLRVTGVSPTGFLVAESGDKAGGSSRGELSADGHSMDFFEGLVRRKLT